MNTKQWCWLLAAMIGLTLMVFTIVLLDDMKQRQRFHEIWGPNPGQVDFKTNWGGEGYMAVRDLDNAEAEVQAMIQEEWEHFKTLKEVQVKGNLPPLQVTILKKTPRAR